MAEDQGGLKFACAHASQRSMCTSVPQTLAAWTWTNTSPGPGSGTGTSRMAAPGRAVSLTRARMVRIGQTQMLGSGLAWSCHCCMKVMASCTLKVLVISTRSQAM